MDRLLGLLLLGPGILLALPGPLAALWLDPYPRLAGAGLAAMAAAPMALLLLWRPPPLSRARDIRGPLLLAILLYQGLAFATFGGTTDTFEARRALTLAAACLVLLCGAGNLGREGRRWFLSGVLVLSAVWTGFALVHTAFTSVGRLEGVLGNTGPLSQAALPGAAIGAWLAMRRRGWWLLPGLGVLGLFLAHAVIASIHAALVSICLVFLFGAWRARRDPPEVATKRLPWILLAVTCVAMLGVRTYRSFGEEAPVREAVSADFAAPIGGGAEVRLRIWKRLPALLVDAPVFGIGPGQFLATFPPHRDPREAVLSRGGICSGTITEVEHPHNDWLHGIVQYGIFGGALWVIFLLLSLRACIRAMRHDHAGFAPAGAAGFAVLVNALFHAPLLVSPASAVLAFPLFGLLLEEDGRNAPRFNRMLLTRVTGVLGLFAAWVALPLVLHGHALADFMRAQQDWEHGRIEATAHDEAIRDAIARALRAAPNSVSAGLLRVRLGGEADALPLLDGLQKRRPYSLEILDRKGEHLARAERYDEARVAWEGALALDPSHPHFLRNLIRLEMTAGKTARGREMLDRLRTYGCLEPEWIERLGTELLLTARLEGGVAVLSEIEPRLRTLDPDLANGLSRKARQQGLERRADALRTMAQLLWARDHVANGNLTQAVRSYRLALAATRQPGMPEGAAAVRLEKGAAEWRAGLEDEARRTLEGFSASRTDRELIPSWARETLDESGLGR